VKNRRWLQSVILLVGLAAVAIVIEQTVSDTEGKVLPTAPAFAGAAVFCVVAIVASARAWVALFSDLVMTRPDRAALRGTFYLAQFTKYVPAGGLVQAASQVGLAGAIGIPFNRVAVAFPVSVVGAVAAGGTLASGLVFEVDLAGWIRLLSLLGLATPLLLHRGLMSRVLERARRFIHRIPHADHLPTQRDILAFYGWALLTMAPLSIAYTVLLQSVTTSLNPFFVACAFAASWVVGFLAVPIPAGVGIREAVLVVLIPGVGAAPLLAASLALRLLSIGAELLAFLVNKVITRRQGVQVVADPAAEELTFP
jgi:glycosyltransferase 2 family protein